MTCATFPGMWRGLGLLPGLAVRSIDPACYFTLTVRNGVSRLIHVRKIDKRHCTVLRRAGGDMLVEA